MEMHEATAQKMQQVGRLIKNEFPDLGFCLLVFTFEKPGIGNYVSNANRQDMVTSLRETADRLERGQEFPTINSQ
jgi:hypothetical protein